MLFSKEVQNKFVRDIEQLANRDHSYMEAVLTICDEYEIEPRVGAKFLTQPIIEKIEKEGMEYNLLSRKSSELPV
jgi:hypothetical protein